MNGTTMLSHLAQFVRLLRFNCEGDYALQCGTSTADSFHRKLSYDRSEPNTTSTFGGSNSTVPDATADVTVMDDEENVNRVLKSFLYSLFWVGALFLLICFSQSCMRLSEWWMRRRDPNYGQETAASDEPQQLDTGIISRKARLFGLTLEERKRILDKIFESTSFVYSEKDQHIANDPNLVPSKSSGESLKSGKGAALDAQNQQSEPNRARSATVETTTEERDLELGEKEGEGKMGVASKPTVTGEHTRADHDSKPDKGDEIDDKSIQEYQDLSCCLLASESSADGTDKLCSICLAEYEDNDLVIVGAKCSHIFHKECATEWSSKHDLCPYCRTAMISAKQMRLTAKQVLGKKRIQEMDAVAKIKFAAAQRAHQARNNATAGEHPTNATSVGSNEARPPIFP